MNRLVNAVIARPQVIEQAAGQERASFEFLMRVLGNDLFSDPERQLIEGDPELRSRLHGGYLPTISATDWEHALSLTANRTAASSGWWTVMIPATDGRSGLTAPQDGSETALVALFTGPPENVRVLAYDPANGSAVEIASGRHCGRPSRGLCGLSRCPNCVAVEVYDQATGGPGIKCICPHQAV
jgi:hypothetical protein